MRWGLCTKWIKAKGVSKGDAMIMPLLFALGQRLAHRTRCGDMRASRCMQAKRKCEIGQASDQKLAEERARVRRGGLETESRERGIKILGTPLGNSCPPRRSQRGLCCCIAQQQEPITSSGLCRFTAHTLSRWPKMSLCCGSRKTCARVALVATRHRWHWPPQCRPHCYSGVSGKLG